MVSATAAMISLSSNVIFAQANRPPVSNATAPLTLDSAKSLARLTSAELRAADEAVSAARARERQAQAFVNPTLSYGREQTAKGGLRNSQDIAQVEQPIEIGGQRDARKNATASRTKSAEARRASVLQQLDFDVTQAFYRFYSAARRAALVDSAVNTFREAERVSAERLAAGDESGYATRRLRLEAARYATQRAEAALTLRSTRIDLATLLGVRDAELASPQIGNAAPAFALSVDSLVTLGLRQRGEIKAAEFEVMALGADARLVKSERIPTPILSAGYKGENVKDGSSNGSNRLNGFVAGFSLPLPMFDRSASAIQAANADTRHASALVDKTRREIDRDVRRAYESLQAVDEQVRLLEPHVGNEATLAMRAVQLSYREGEITLVEWLDAVRAYQESEIAIITLQTEAAIRRAALERAVGSSLFVR